MGGDILPEMLENGQLDFPSLQVLFLLVQNSQMTQSVKAEMRLKHVLSFIVCQFPYLFDKRNQGNALTPTSAKVSSSNLFSAFFVLDGRRMLWKKSPTFLFSFLGEKCSVLPLFFSIDFLVGDACNFL